MAAPIRPIRGRAGEFQVLGRSEPIRLVEWREDSIYDTVNLQSGTTSTANGTELLFFDSLSNKKKRDTNLLQVHKIPAGWEVIVMKLGVYTHMTTGNTEFTGADVKKVYENASILVEINNTPIADGWVLNYGVGIGLSGSTTENAQAYISPGVPSPSAAPTLLVPQNINNDHDIRGTLRFDNFSWATTSFSQPSLSVGGTAKLIFRGFIKRALGKG